MTARRPCVKCGRNRAERFFTSPRGRTCQTCRKTRVRGASRAARLEQTYGITAADYEKILEFQGGRCEICGRQPRYNLDVDHDHKTGAVRGLLCKVCNRRLLPAARDDQPTLIRAWYYLEFPPARAALGRVATVPGSSA